MRNERWNTSSEIKRKFCDSTDLRYGAGPVVFAETGRRYIDDSEGHMLIAGKTGCGKSQCASLPFLEEVFTHRESVVVIDPKSELYHKCSCRVPEDYQIFCVDFENPRKSPDAWNPLLDAFDLFKSKELDDHDLCASLVSEFIDALFPLENTKEPFWNIAARSYIKGLAFGLFEHASSKEQINLSSICRMMQQSENRYAVSTVIKAFYELLSADSLARRNLSGYVSGPNDTRASIHATAEAQLEDVIARSSGLIEMLSNDTINIRNIDIYRPFVIWLLIPDYTDVYSALAGVLVSQFAQHLIRKAQTLKKQRLPVRCNFILEELGSVGKSIPSLKSLMVAGRSRNIRMMLVLQSPSQQLTDIYGQSAADTIMSCIGLTVGFSTNNWNTLTEWSQRCGERNVEIGGHLVKEPLITPAQLYAMPTGTALILKDELKFITQLPFYYTYNLETWIPPQLPPYKKTHDTRIFDLQTYVTEQKRKAMISASAQENRSQSNPFATTGKPTFGPLNPADIDSMLKDIDQKLAELDAEEKAQLQNKAKMPLYCIAVISANGNADKVSDIIASVTGAKKQNILKALNNNTPFEYPFPSKKAAQKAAKEIVAAGGIATVVEHQFEES